MDVEVTFDSSSSVHCVQVTALLDTLIEGPETFSVTVTVGEEAAVSPGGSVLVTIEDGNEGEVVVSFAESAYSEPEGSGVDICLQVTSDILNLQRDVELSLVTRSESAQGKTSAIASIYVIGVALRHED